ncbi:MULTISPECIES: YqzL family protein [Bacillaceae]|uniref:YqzL family protein n=1 Tax=Evansella alkalicola TaxID=745819 RepID=A0ABS6JVB1_9BACI|nr:MULTISPECIES: YqzL family protein [Bacillaceae]MBU9722494.1 YqzL family protein [Bacillus alkalicola]
MIDLTWKVFSMTGNIDSYLLFKEMERDGTFPEYEEEDGVTEEFDSTTH